MQYVSHVVPQAQLLADLRAQDALPQLQRPRPGEAVLGQLHLAPEPGIAAEHLVAALAGDHRARETQNLLRKQHQRGIHVRHAREAPQPHRPIQPLRQRLLIQHDAVMAGAEGAHRQADVGRVHLRTEGVGHEVGFILRIIHGKALHPSDAGAQERRQRGRIHAAGEHARRVQRHDLVYGLLQQLPHPRGGGSGVVPVFPRLQFKVAPAPHALPVADQHAARLQRLHAPQRRPSGRARRAQAHQLAQRLPIHHRLHKRRLEDGVRVVGEHQSAAAPRKEQAALPHPVPAQKQPVAADIRHAAHARPLDVPGIVLAPALIGAQRQRRLRGVGCAAQLPRKRAAVAHAAVDHRHAVRV